METPEPKDSSNYTVRFMLPEETKEMYELIDKEGWNLSLDKFRILYEAYPQLFYVAESPDGDIAGTMSLYPTFEGEYVLGNIVVKEGHRFKGLGRKLIIDILNDTPHSVVSCTAVPGADQFYLKMGFVHTQPEQGHDIFHIEVDCDTLQKKAQGVDNDKIIIESYNHKHSADIVAYDKQARGYQNTSYVEMQVKCFEVMLARDWHGKMLGFGVAFVKRGEVVLDGLYADSDAVAFRLVICLMRAFPGINSLKLQVPSSNTFLSTLGVIKSSYKYNRYHIGSRPPTHYPQTKVYNVSDCDYTC